MRDFALDEIILIVLIICLHYRCMFSFTQAEMIQILSPSPELLLMTRVKPEARVLVSTVSGISDPQCYHSLGHNISHPTAI